MRKTYSIETNGTQMKYSGTYEAIQRGTLVEVVFTCTSKIFETKDAENATF